MSVTTAFWGAAFVRFMLLAGIFWCAAAGGVMAQSADQGREVLAAQFEQGVEAYDAGRFERAFELWLPLAQNGDLAAQRNVAHMLRLGRGVAQDLPRARKFYEQSAEFGFVTAQTNLAVMLLKGEGGGEDVEDAAMWFDRAARGGHPIAQYNLARLYEQGKGVEPSPGMALGWYALAAKSGYQPALDRLTELVMILPGPGSASGETDETVEQTASPGKPHSAGDEQDAPEEDVIAEEIPDMQDVEETAEEVEPGEEIDVSATEPEVTEPEVTEPQVPEPEVPEPEAKEPEAVEPDAEQEAAPVDTSNANDLAADVPVTNDLIEAVAAYEAKRFDDARHGFEALAYRGDATAQYWLARMRNRGEGEPRDPVAALAWWTVAAEGGHERSARAARDLANELDARRRNEAGREAAQFKALIGQLTGTSGADD